MTKRHQVFCHGGRQLGRGELVRLFAEAMLDAGKTVYYASTGELRGAATAKDITPASGRREIGNRRAENPDFD